MANKIKPKRSYTANAVPTTSDVDTHELAINWADGKAFTKNASGQIVTVTLGGGGGSSEDATLRALFVPPAPTNVAGTVGNAQVSLTWTAPTVLAQTPITSYTVQYSSDTGSTWSTWGTAPTTNSATVTGLTNNTAYVFRVSATNGAGTSGYSTASSSVTPAAGDAYWSNVQLLMHLDGSNNGTTFTDSSSAARSITRGGGVVTSTAAKKFGTASAYFAASGDYLGVTDAASTELAGNDWAIEMWINTTSSTQYATLISRTPGSFAAGMWSLMINHDSNTSGELALYVSDFNGGTSTVMLSSGASSLRDGAWHHVAVSRSGSALNMYIDGTRRATGTASSNVSNINGDINIGRDQFYGRQFTGYIDDLRLTIGSARGYTGSTITVPTAAFPDS